LRAAIARGVEAGTRQLGIATAEARRREYRQQEWKEK
jgi:hypothetical protein